MRNWLDGMEGEMENGIELDGDLARGDLLPRLSTTGLETLLASLDPLLDGFGAGPSCLDDALAYLNRLAASAGDGDSGKAETGAMVEWIEIWRSAGGNRATLRLMVQSVLAERMSLEG
ncbi:MAG: hypothetical protein ACKOPT_08790 [Cyanobium sp.]